MTKKTKTTDDPWDSRTLGAEAAYVGVADESHERALDDALGLQAISIRLPEKATQRREAAASAAGESMVPKRKSA